MSEKKAISVSSQINTKLSNKKTYLIFFSLILLLLFLFGYIINYSSTQFNLKYNRVEYFNYSNPNFLSDSTNSYYDTSSDKLYLTFKYIKKGNITISRSVDSLKLSNNGSCYSNAVSVEMEPKDIVPSSYAYYDTKENKINTLKDKDIRITIICINAEEYGYVEGNLTFLSMESNENTFKEETVKFLIKNGK